jgi:uncharacterized protein YjbI with pentapeptide repeats
VQSWLSRDAKSDPLRVVTGGPGSGKSSFARAFAHEVIQMDKHRVLFIQLQHMTLTGSLFDDIARYVDRRDTFTGENGSPGLPGNPFDWRKTDETPLLIIFDGLDELSTKEEDSERYARELLLALKLLLSPLNTDGASIRALVLGRNLACQAAMESSNIPLNNMLNVAPIARMSKETCMISSSPEHKVSDPEGIMENDQREDYWRKWAAIKGEDPETMPEAITADSMKELNVEPLLLHLLMISKYSGDEWEVAAGNRNVVYEDILQKILDRNKEKDHFLAAGVTEGLFFELMECLGIAAWRGNGRTGDEDEFRLIRKLHLNREKMFKNFPAASLKSVALNIHTRAGQKDASSGFEFIHKSFGEYLAARGLLSHAIKTAVLLEEREAEDIEMPWSQIIGSAELTPEIITFLYDEARLKLTSNDAVGLKDELTELINWTLTNGFSVHKIGPELQWADLLSHQRCSISALIASTSAMATAIPIGDWDEVEFGAPWTVNIAWPENRLYRSKMQLNYFGVTDETTVVGALRRINFSDQELWDTGLNRTNLEGADFRGARSTWGLFIGSNFAGANLKFWDAANIRMRNVDLMGCNLSFSQLRSATFEGVNMRGCDLNNADLSDVDASSSRGSMSGSPYSDMRVRGSIDLEGANLADANLSAADLSGAVNLSLEAVNSAFGTDDTKLPDYIVRSKVVWLEKGYVGKSRGFGSSFYAKFLKERRQRKLLRGT